MSLTGRLLFGFFGLTLVSFSTVARAQNIHISIPLRSQLTPVQKLNREGVDAVQGHHYDKAERLFYKAYLFDPDDPFTLNNLGYVSEIQGQVDRAEKFYQLATLQDCNATIDRTSLKTLKGKPMMDALGSLKNLPMRINRINVLGTQLLAKGRNFEADAVFRQALALDPGNPFTLNNLGVANEGTGNWDDAVRFYDQAAALQSKATIVMSSKANTRGKPVSAMAAKSAQDLRKRMARMTPDQIRAVMVTVRGVYATNQNDWTVARQDFLEASTLNPENAFTLNNLGYVAEHDGDLETAKEYYARALRAEDAGGKVGMSTEAAASGRQLSIVADESQKSVDEQLEIYSQKRRGQKGPIQLKRRPGSVDPNPPSAPSAPSATPPSAANPPAATAPSAPTQQ